MEQLTFDQLLEAGCHFGHLTRKWHPNMAPYIFMEKNGIHIIDLNKTLAKLEEANQAGYNLGRAGKKILFVGTKKQAKEIIGNAAKSINMPYITERWPGGLLTNFVTIRKSIKKMQQIDKMMNDPTFSNISKRERLQLARQRAKLEKTLGSIVNMVRLPSAIFVVDIVKEHIAVAEAHKLNIPVFAIIDTNANPQLVDYPIPANDDAAKSIQTILESFVESVKKGLNERIGAMEDAEKEDEEFSEEKLKEKKIKVIEASVDAEEEGKGNKQRRTRKKE
ncbi:MAG: 30S ribosomal protein S2 [Bacteroidetes bacterium ADurb.Bin035]|jgi:small subunit ribosomal protein S2|nr:30S ribosomal protein S2 [Bacteroidales bacterium]OQC45031.1 MAG: 30S ribosomal protein S2 [Bacteroidetes bacterium ADurb.Bin035]MBP8946032.1 30S ribosomal protein S2 [Bacteroidales bacterium]HNW20861.1 30S ribosomal protein S2 [Bacteroidales bacterium]HNY75226.1 30S ribosomal protein S2 [Bacteroidales bacterium]